MYDRGVAEATDFQSEMKQLLRDRALDAAAEIAAATGWHSVNMSEIATIVGISRPLLYKEVGAKQALGEALVAREAGRFIEGVLAQYHANPTDPFAGMRAATRYTLTAATTNPLLKSLVAGTWGENADLLPLLLSQPEPILQRTVNAVFETVSTVYADLLPQSAEAPRLLHTITETGIRLTISHLLQPTGPIEDAIEQVSWALSQVMVAAFSMLD